MYVYKLLPIFFSIIVQSIYKKKKELLSFYFFINLNIIEYFCCIDFEKLKNFIIFFKKNIFFNFFLIDIIFIDLSNFIVNSLFFFNQKVKSNDNFIYVLQNYIQNFKFYLKINTITNKDKESILTNIDSLSLFYPSSIWLEREIYDMFGIFFKDNFDLRRILTDYSFEGHPLKKNYPTTGFFEININIKKNVINNNDIFLIKEFVLKNNNFSW